jgi:ferredoxin-type protein NapH
LSELDKKATREVADRSGWLSSVRWKVQLLAFLVLNSLVPASWRPYRLKGACVPVLNCHGCPAAATYCPIGVIGDMLSLRVVPWLALGAFGLVGIIFGRLSCGWICPFGFLQDLIAKIPVPKWKPPKWTGYIKYAVLGGMVFVAPLVVGVDSRWFFCGICPDATIMANGWKAAFDGGSVSSTRLIFLGIFLLLSLFVVRGFCRMVCPIGAGLAFFNRFSLLSLKFKKRWCSECMQCLRECPVDIGPMADPRSPECIYCGQCFKCHGIVMDFSDEAGTAAGAGGKVADGA